MSLLASAVFPSRQAFKSFWCMRKAQSRVRSAQAVVEPALRHFFAICSRRTSCAGGNAYLRKYLLMLLAQGLPATRISPYFSLHRSGDGSMNVKIRSTTHNTGNHSSKDAHGVRSPRDRTRIQNNSLTESQPKQKIPKSVNGDIGTIEHDHMPCAAAHFGL